MIVNFKTIICTININDAIFKIRLTLPVLIGNLRTNWQTKIAPVIKK